MSKTRDTGRVFVVSSQYSKIFVCVSPIQSTWTDLLRHTLSHQVWDSQQHSIYWKCSTTIVSKAEVGASKHSQTTVLIYVVLPIIHSYHTCSWSGRVTSPNALLFSLPQLYIHSYHARSLGDNASPRCLADACILDAAVTRVYVPGPSTYWGYTFVDFMVMFAKLLFIDTLIFLHPTPLFFFSFLCI